MKYFLKVLREDKKHIKMNNQTDKGFDLIFLDDKVFNRSVNKLNYCYKRNIDVYISWEFKGQRNTFKVYKNVKIKEIKDNFNPFKNKIQGKVITFTCEDIEYYTPREGLVGEKVGVIGFKSMHRFKYLNKLNRAMKISKLSFDIKN